MRVLTRIADTTLQARGTSISALAEEIQKTVAVVEKAHAVHNVGYSATLFDQTRAALLEATSQTEVGQTLDSYLEGELRSFRDAPSCLQRCHYGINNRTSYLKNQDRVYPHGPHITQARLDCGECHSREIHKVNLPRGYDCSGCHHESAAQKPCMDCHKDTFDFAEGGFAGFDVASAQNLECQGCHEGQRDEIVRLNRSACRDCHLDDQKYLDLLEREREDLGRLSAEVKKGFDAHWGALDFEGLQLADQVRHVESVNGIHNYPLAMKVYKEAQAYLARLGAASGMASGRPSPE
jgi:hypothetical protein